MTSNWALRAHKIHPSRPLRILCAFCVKAFFFSCRPLWSPASANSRSCRGRGRGREAMTVPADTVQADPLDITYGEMLPFLSWRELRHRGFLGPGIATALFGIAMFIAANSKPNGRVAVLYILSGFLGLASLYLITLWCGRKMPFWYVFLVALTTFAVNAVLLFPTVGYANDRLLHFPLAPALTEEPWKALPLLLIW